MGHKRKVMTNRLHCLKFLVTHVDIWMTLDGQRPKKTLDHLSDTGSCAVNLSMSVFLSLCSLKLFIRILCVLFSVFLKNQSKNPLVIIDYFRAREPIN